MPEAAERPALLLAALEGVRDQFDPLAARLKLDLLRRLERARLPRAQQVKRLHEALCFLRAYPDNAALLAQVERLLGSFERRADLRRHRAALRDTGIAGTEIRYRFFYFMAEWLARRWGDRLRVDWRAFEGRSRLENRLHLLALYAETPALDEYALGVKAWVDRMRGRRETDAAFLVRRFQRLRLDAYARETFFEELDVPMRLAPGPTTPSRTHARYPGRTVVFQSGPLLKGRPRLGDEAARPPFAVRSVTTRAGRRLVDLAREAMVTRSRDLDVFAHGDPRDVRLVDCGGGLQFALIGAIPQRRLLLEAVYGLLTLKNGVPLGYSLVSALYASSEIAYNVFETYRGNESAAIYGRVLATVRHVFGSDSFTIYPYQLGHENDEALRSGAWWFYRKLGFAPRKRALVDLMRRETKAMKRDPAYRSNAATLKTLATGNLFWSVARPRPDVIGVLALPTVGLRVMEYLGRRFGSDRERAARTCSLEAARLLGVAAPGALPPHERLAWERWAPLVLLLPGVERWTREDKRGLARVVRAKGGRRESDFARLFDRHKPLRRAVMTLAGRE